MAISTELSNTLFDQFWNAGMRKAGSRKITCKTFLKVLKEAGGDPVAFTNKLIDDIQLRLANKQFGFDKQHPRSYLNGECWEDEVVNDAEDKLGTNAAGYRQTVPERLDAAGEEYLRRKAGAGSNAQVLEGDGSNLWPDLHNSIRDDSNRCLGAPVNGYNAGSDCEWVEPPF